MDVDKVFKWRTRADKWILPREMDSHHLFYTLKMIWNHSVPEHMKLKPYRQYNFCPTIYTKDYIMTAIKALMVELKTREDKDKYLFQLNLIHTFIRKYGINLIVTGDSLEGGDTNE